MSDQEHVDVVYEPDNKRFTITVDGVVAGYANYFDGSGYRDFNHTVVKPEFRGKGLSHPLVKAALDHAREEGLRVHASCSAVSGFIAKNSEYADLTS